jgi:hypothetical protein
MKRFLLIFMLCVTANVVFAQIQEVLCKVINKSSYFDFDSFKYPYKGALQPGEIINAMNLISYSWIPSENNNKFLIYFNKVNDIYCTFPQNLVPVKTSMFFEQDIITDTTTFLFNEVIICKEMWVPVHYADVLGSRDRETLPKHEPRLLDYNKAGADAHYGTSEWYEIEEIYDGIRSGMVVFFNPIIYTHGGEFLIKTIEKHEYGYKVECFVPYDIYDEYSNTRLMPYFNWDLCTGETITMFLHIDGECMDIFINKTDVKHKFGTIIKVKEGFISQFQNLIKNGKCDLSKVHFPRRADGSTDYSLPELAIDADLFQTEDKISEAAIEKKAITQNNGEASPLPLWAWFAIIGGAAVVVGGGIVFAVKRRK